MMGRNMQSAGSAAKRFVSIALDPESGHAGAEVVEMSHYYSAQADQTRLLDHIFNLEGYIPCSATMRETVVFINHGEIAANQPSRKPSQIEPATVN